MATGKKQSVYLPADLHADLAAEAAKDDRSVNAVVRILLREAMLARQLAGRGK